MDKEVDLGKRMWQMLSADFDQVVRESGATKEDEKSRVWAGFLAGAAGAMAADVGKDNADAILSSVVQALRISSLHS